MRPTRPALALAFALCLPSSLTFMVACGERASDEQQRATERHEAASPGDRVEALIAEPDYATLRELLAQGHAVAREQLGPHRLRYQATISTTPAGIDPTAPLPDVAVDQPIYERFVVEDTLELVWAAGPGEPPKLALDQHNQLEHGRALILIDEREWADLDGRGWFERPAETDLWQLWADDAQHAVLDLLELAGPYAEIAAVEPIDEAGRAAVRVSLRASESRHPERIADGLTPWRADAPVRVVLASIVLDRATGLWLRASFDLSWSFEDSAHREILGHARLEGSVEPLAEPPAIVPPADATALPERDRPELLRARLLDGLAGP